MKNVNKTIIGQININSISSKFNQLKELVLKHVDILVVCEAKLDETFPSSQIHMDGFSLPYRLDRNRNGGGFMIFVKENRPSKLLTKHNFPSDVEGLFVELNFRRSNFSLELITHLHIMISVFLIVLIKLLIFTATMIMFYLLETLMQKMSNFLYQHDLYNLGKVGTCFKNSSKPTSIDLFLTTKKYTFCKYRCSMQWSI